MTVPNGLPRDTPTRAEVDRAEAPADRGPCEWCKAGFHYMCTGVGCYQCPKENHTRSQGVSTLGPSVPAYVEPDE